MYSNLPLELRQRPQWVLADMTLNEKGKAKKIPLNPRTRLPADVTDPSTWSTFAEARATGASHIGYVLAAPDPYCIIDLDSPESSEQAERHSAILAATRGYAEFSQSGAGVHIIVRGGIPHGVRRDKIEVYSAFRYMICTGNVFRAGPILDNQKLLDNLFAEMASTGTVELEELPEIQTDDLVLKMAETALNCAKFNLLWEGNWQGKWPSQSEADFALMAILAFYSQSNEQCRRLFKMSNLGRREKAQREKYLNYMLGKIRAKQPLTVDFTQLLHQANEIAKKETITENQATAAHPGGNSLPGPGNETRVGPPRRPDTGSLPYPPGLVGEVARYFHNSSIRPVPEIAIAAALAVSAGVAGRSYNISGTGLNQYLVLVATTGSGKEGAASGIERLIAAVRQTVPMADSFIGPAAFASGQAFVRVLDVKPCFLSILGEFGITMQQMCDPRATKAESMLMKVILDSFGKSGFHQILRPSAYSDTEKNTALVQAPNVTLLGETTPEQLYGKLDSSHIVSGLLPRFSLIEYTGPRPARNRHAFGPPPEELVKKFADLCTVALTCRQNNTHQVVAISPDALVLLDKLDEEATGHINHGDASEVERHLWNRAHLKVIKLAALLAVGRDMQAPVVDVECTEWALNFVRRDISNLLARFASGEMGSTENKQEADLKAAIRAYLKMPWARRAQYAVPEKIQNDPVIPYHYLRRRMRTKASFTSDRLGACQALENIIEGMVKADALVLVPRALALENYGAISPLYTLGTTF